MYRKLLATTALSLVMTGGAFAQMDAAPAPAPMDQPVVDAPATSAAPLVNAADRGISADGWLATEIIGESIFNSTADDADTIGEVNDFVLDHNGSIGAVVVGVGGFLGIGQKNVAINWDDLELVTNADGDHRLVANMTREQLENAAEFDRSEWLASERASGAVTAPADPMAPSAAPMDPVAPAPAPMAPGAAPMDPATTPAPMAPAEPGLAAPGTDGAFNWDTYVEVPTGEVTADELTGTTVYGFDDEDIGSIGDIVLSDAGEVEAVIIDFGGFLGIGTKPVAVSFDNLEFLRNENGDLVLRTSLTREQLEAAPEYDADAYVAAPDQNVVIVR